MILIKTIKRQNNFPFIFILFLFLISCEKKIKEIEYQEACFFKKINGEEILICDEERMNKVKVQIHPYSKEFKICEKFEYSTKIDGEMRDQIGIRCPTSFGYEIIR